jgi:hypothetical protein
METYKHVLDLSNKLKCLNLAHSERLYSLFAQQIIIDYANPINNPRNLSETDLRNCLPGTVPAPANPWMVFLYKAAFNREYNQQVTEVTAEIERRAEAEIQFELRRRLINDSAPSRLSALYLAEDSFDGGIMLHNMFRNSFSQPKVLQVSILDNLALFKADHRWYEDYHETGSEQSIDNYWSGLSFDEQNLSWEYLLEGSISLVNAEDFDELVMHAHEHWPEEFID